jgi:N-acetylglucosaminyldiphosphoundecaprenol N-acetyl-beta-D-mannosaminyltransferase
MPADFEKSVRLRGVGFDALTESECAQAIVSEAAAGRGGWVVTPNLDILRLCVRDPSIRELVDGASVVVADGMPLVWASRLQGTPLPERVAGSNLISSVAERASEDGCRVFLLGGDLGVAEAAARVLQRRYPALEVAGIFYPEIGFEDDPAQMAAIRDAIASAKPQIVFVALSFPKGERLIAELRPGFRGIWWIGVGISFSFVAGEVKRAPAFLRRIGLEWLHRLFAEPRKLAKRYLVHGIPFALSLLIRSALRREG